MCKTPWRTEEIQNCLPKLIPRDASAKNKTEYIISKESMMPEAHSESQTNTLIRERPILFSTEMVRAILDGEKTQTRRVIKPQPDLHKRRHRWGYVIEQGVLKYGRAPWRTTDPFNFLVENEIKCPFGKVSDKLWVRETWYCDHFWERDYDQTSKQYIGKVLSRAECESEWRGKDDDKMYYRADVPSGRFEDAGYWSETGSYWKPSIHMPRWASRINLEISNVGIERIQDGGDREFWGEQLWKTNPWVWVIDFKRI